MIVVLEGIDGAGKSTVAPLVFARLAPRFPESRYRTKKDIESDDPHVVAHMTRIRDMLWTQEPPDNALGTEYWTHLLAAWYGAFNRTVLRTVVQNGELAVFDGWFHRNVAKTVVRSGWSRVWIESLFASVAVPDFVVLLDLDPAVAFDRRGDYKPTELGRWDGYTGGIRESFVAYQGEIRRLLLEMAAEKGWTVVPQTRSTTAEEIAAAVVAAVEERCSWIAARPAIAPVPVERAL